MSRIGKKPITIPQGVEINLKDQNMEVKGPKGTLSQDIHRYAQINIEGDQLNVTVLGHEKRYRSVQGLVRSLVANMIEGVTKGFEKRLEMVGTGYRGVMKGSDLELQLGFSHPVLIKAEGEIELAVEGNNKIIVRGIDKQQVGQVAAQIRSLRKPDPYLGKGVRYQGEHIRRKVGKSGA